MLPFGKIAAPCDPVVPAKLTRHFLIWLISGTALASPAFSQQLEDCSGVCISGSVTNNINVIDQPVWTGPAGLTLDLGVAPGGRGEISVVNGGKFEASAVRVGEVADSTGIVVVSGAGSEMRLVAQADDPIHALTVGDYGSGRLSVSDNARVIIEASRGLILGAFAGGSGEAVVESGGQVLVESSSLDIGVRTTGNLVIRSGGLVKSLSGRVGWETGGRGTATISDGGRWEIANNLIMGEGSGTGVITVGNQGALDVGDDLVIYSDNILVLSGGGVQIGGQANFDGGTLRVAAGGTFDGAISLATKGATIDVEVANNLELSKSVSGSGGLHKIGYGTLTLTGENTYTGGTRISAGTLQIGNGGTTGSITGNVNNNNGTLIFNRSDDFTFSGSIDDSGHTSTPGNLIKQGSGTLILTGDVTQRGGTRISAGTLQIGNGGTTGSITGNVANNGTLVVNRSDNLLLDGIISGSGNFVKQGSGRLTLAGENTYAGGTTISGGSLDVDRDSNLGDASGSLTIDNATLNMGTHFDNSARNVTLGANGGTFNNSFSFTRLFGTISGSGALTKTGSSTLVLTGDNTYTGGTTISAGTLQIGNGGTTGSITGNVANNGILRFSLGRERNMIFDGIISGRGKLEQGGFGTPTAFGTLSLTGDNTYTGGTLIRGGTLRVASDNNLGDAAGTLDFEGGTLWITDNFTSARTGSINAGNGTGGVFRIDDDKIAKLSGLFTGAGRLTKAADGTLILTGENTYSGGTTISAGTLQIGNGGTTGSITGNVANNGILAFNRSDSVTFGGVVSGSGKLNQAGSGTLILTGENTYSGGTTIAAGILQTGDGGTTGSITGNVANNGTLTFNRSDSVTFGGVVSGSGKLNQAGSGTLILTGENTYAGGTTISAGTLQIGDGGTTGSITGNINNNNGTLIFNRNDDVTFGGDINDSGPTSTPGNLIKRGSGTLILTGNAIHRGGTTISEGTLQMGNGGRVGYVYGDVANNGSFVSNLSSTMILDGIISGSGNFVQQGSGIVALTGENTYAGGTTISAGTLSVSRNSNLGAASGGLTINNATLQLRAGFESARNVTLLGNGGTVETASEVSNTLSGVVGGSGALTKAGAGTLILTGENTYAGGTTISAGTLQIGDGGTTGSITGNVANTGILAFNRSDSLTFGGVVSGSGKLNQAGSGTLILTGENTYAGGTTISAGTLQVGNGGTTGSITGDVTNSSTLAFNRSNNLDFSGILSGNGTLRKSGSGILTLIGDSIGFAGTTSVDAGRLDVTGQLGGSVNVASGASLSGWGTIGGNTTIANGATLVGRPDETLTFAQNLTLGASSNVTVEYGALFANPFFNVQGNLALGGTLNVTDFGSNGPGIYRVFDYSGTLSGTLAIGDLPANITDRSRVNLQTSRAGQVNLVNAFGAKLNFWDGQASDHNNGVIDGGDGTWDASNNNWTDMDGVLNGKWSSDEFAVFGGNKGTVTVDNSKGQVTATGMQFSVDGYLVTGDDIRFASSSENPGITPIIRVGAGEQKDRELTATISSNILGTEGIKKTGYGTLVLSADNNYTGGTTVSGGKLQLGNGGNSGSVVGDINLGDQDATLGVNRAGAFTLANTISGIGQVTIDGTGEVELAGTNSYSGGTLINHGVLITSADNNLGTGSVQINNGAALRLSQSFNSDRNYALGNGGGVIDAAQTNTIIGAIGGTGSLTKTGSGTLIVAGNNTYSGGTTIRSGALQIGNGSNAGSIAGDITNNGRLIFNRSDEFASSGIISGSGSVEQAGLGDLYLKEANTYTGGTIISRGMLNVAADENLGDRAGSLTLRGGTFANTSVLETGRSVILRDAGGSFKTDCNLTLTGAFDAQEQAAWHKTGAGELIFAGVSGNMNGALIREGKVIVDANSDMTGDYTVISSGVLDIQGTQDGKVDVVSGGTLLGSGTVGKSVNVADGGKLLGQSGSVLTIGGDLNLDAGSEVNVSLGMTSQNALFDVKGNLTLAGTLNITDGGGFGPGLYRLFDYQGSLTNNTLVIGRTPVDASRMWIDSDTARKQINLISAAGVKMNVWDGGSGTWSLIADHSNDVWTDNEEQIKGPYDQGSFALFRGTGGTVTIDNGAGKVSAAGMQFASDGYVITGDGVTLDNSNGGTGQPIIRVGDGSDAGRSIIATIEAELAGTRGLNKTDYGTLILSAANHYTGGTTVSAGVLQIGTENGTSGSIDGNVDLVKNNNGSGTLAFARGDATRFDGNITGGGNVLHKGSGTTTFGGDNSYAGGLTVENGTARAGIAGHAFGTGALRIKGGAIADLDGFDTVIGGLAAFDAKGDTTDGDITLGSGKLTTDQNFDGRYSGLISGSGSFTKAGKATLTLAGVNSYTGETTVEGGTLKQGSAGVFNTTSSGYVVGSGATLNLGGFDTTLSALNNAGTITSGVETAGTTLEIAGDYVGNGGMIVINAELGDDSTKTDRLKVNGNTSGETGLKVINRGGLGAKTDKGIRVVEVAGRSEGTFSLVSDYVTNDGQKAVVGGAYAYTLHQNPVKGEKDGDWYLSNKSNENENENEEGKKRYSAGVPVYQGYAQTMEALNKLPTLRERMGDRYWTGQSSDGRNSGATFDGRGAWARIEGAHNHLEAQSATGMKNDVNTFIMQAGVEGQFYEDEHGTLFGGITGQYGTAQGKAGSVDGSGRIDTHAWSIGATTTWYGNNGFYFDGQGQISWFDNNLSSDTANAGLASGNKAWGYALSLEAGQRIAISEHWTLTPQAQLMWGSLKADAFRDVWGNRVHLQNGDSLTGRLGLAASYSRSWKDDAGQSVNASIYGIANIYQQFTGKTRVNVAGVAFGTQTDKSWAGIGAGGAYGWSEGKYSVFGEATVNTSLNHFADSYAIRANLGFKMQW